MKICIYCQKWESGGIESFLYNMLSHMDRTGLAIDLVTDRIRGSIFTEPMEALGVRVIELSGDLRKVRENRRLFAQLLQKERYDAVHVNAFQGLSLAMLKLAKEAGVPIRVAHSHGADLRPSPTKQLKLLLHRWGRLRYGKFATHRLACSQKAAAFLFGAGTEFAFFPNAIETARFAFDGRTREAVRTELGLDGAFAAGHVGRFDEMKNQSFLVDVFAELQTLRPDSRLLLVGDGETFCEVRKKAESLGLSDRMVFAGVQTDPERYLQAMDVFVFPSHAEGFGIAAVEAQTAGLPVLCSDAVPDEALVTPLAKRLPLSAGAKAWAQALVTMKNEDRTAAADAVRKAGFDLETAAGRLGRLYKGNAYE